MSASGPSGAEQFVATGAGDRDDCTSPVASASVGHLVRARCPGACTRRCAPWLRVTLARVPAPPLADEDFRSAPIEQRGLRPEHCGPPECRDHGGRRRPSRRASRGSRRPVPGPGSVWCGRDAAAAGCGTRRLRAGRLHGPAGRARAAMATGHAKPGGRRVTGARLGAASSAGMSNGEGRLLEGTGLLLLGHRVVPCQDGCAAGA